MNKPLTPRLEKLFSELSPADTFADVGCDHGYIAEKMLETNKCERAIITDISAECLNKAVKLLEKNFSGKFTAIVADGLKGVPKADEALIAGMGGEIICDILKNADHLPEKLVLQPMKNPEKVRRTAIELGYRLTRDYTFKDVKFYDVITAERGEDDYSPDELIFGRDNLRQKGSAFREFIGLKIKKLERAKMNAAAERAEEIVKRIEKYEEILG
ncbi:MAG: SAM-dependent methyltransferase [Clostridia bacterium]|nr:SAM-dependent methyltransferase [Clostridia bacterium]